jgi:hypothetical protein
MRDAILATRLHAVVTGYVRAGKALARGWRPETENVPETQSAQDASS